MTKWTDKDTKELKDFGIQIITIGHLDVNQAKRLGELIGNACERIKQLEAVLVNEKSITAKAYTACGNYQQRIKGLDKALELIWPFIEEDFPKGTGDNHGTCASDLYVLAARQVEQALKGCDAK